MPPRVVPMSPTDPAFVAALRAEGLPTEDLGRPDQRFFALVEDDATLAWGGWEGREGDRLLRSVVVPAAARRGGRARALVAMLERMAAEDGARRLWLLTTDAAPVFEALGFIRVARAEAPAAILAHPQFAGLCPATAICLKRDLAP